MPRQNDEHEYSFDPQNEKSATHWHTSDTPAQKKTQPLNNQEVSKKEDPTLIQRKQEAIALYPNLCKNTLIGIAEVEVYQRICQEAANGTGVDLQKLTIVPNSRKADADNAEAELVGDEMHFASGMFSGVAPKTVELFCHELQHYIDQQKGQVAAPTNLGFNQDPTLEKKAEKAENGTFTNSPEGTNATQNEEVAQFKPKKDTVLGEHKAKKAPYYLYIVGNDAIILNKTTKEAWYKEIANNQTYGISDFETNRATWTAFSAEDYAACTLTPPASLYSFGTPDPNNPQIQNSLPTNSVNATQPSINPATYKQDQAAVKNQPPAPPQNNWLGKFLKVLGEVVVEVGTQMVKEALFITFVEDVTAFVDALKAKDWAKAYQAGLGIASKMPFPLIKGAAAALAVFEEAKEGLKTLQSGDTEAIAKLLLEKGVENRLEGLGDALKNATFPSPPIQTTPPQSIYVPPTPNTPINQVQTPVNQENTPVQTPANQQNTPLKVPNAPIVQQQKTPHNPPHTNTPQNKSSEFDALQAKFVKNGNALPPEQLGIYLKGLEERNLPLPQGSPESVAKLQEANAADVVQNLNTPINGIVQGVLENAQKRNQKNNPFPETVEINGQTHQPAEDAEYILKYGEDNYKSALQKTIAEYEKLIAIAKKADDEYKTETDPKKRLDKIQERDKAKNSANATFVSIEKISEFVKKAEGNKKTESAKNQQTAAQLGGNVVGSDILVQNAKNERLAARQKLESRGILFSTDQTDKDAGKNQFEKWRTATKVEKNKEIASNENLSRKAKQEKENAYKGGSLGYVKYNLVNTKSHTAYQKGNKSAKIKVVRSGYKENELRVKEIFEHGRPLKDDGNTREANADAEYKMLNELAANLGATQKGEIFPEIKGELTIVTENDMCGSCSGTVGQFLDMFPNIKIKIIETKY